MNHIFLTTLNIFFQIIEHNEHIGTSKLLPDFHLDTMCRLYGTTGWRRLDTSNRDRAARLKGTGTLSAPTTSHQASTVSTHPQGGVAPSRDGDVSHYGNIDTWVRTGGGRRAVGVRGAAPSQTSARPAQLQNGTASQILDVVKLVSNTYP